MVYICAVPKTVPKTVPKKKPVPLAARRARPAPVVPVVLPPSGGDRATRRDQLKRGLQTILQQTGDGMRLPPERELAERLGVARETLRRALAELQTDGVLQRRQGAGTFVAGQSWV